ncbi:hypothetical protein [Nitrolancea hollandica]|uniref:Glycosyltransferase RgtA/B/C/D-like domain-containing protein n=1 Tax=Nitrolancea hollandica Lb TaxID=1129897 RepID=I4ELV1_9BACT|nr:hypothetical protein [Nitrolancea hollandica]CCF85664.1 membrane hypothetical protein [Nitrolancea hollandica Lb]
MIRTEPRRRGRVILSLALALVALALFQFGVPLRASYLSWTTGDEPFYLLTAASLAADWDLDVTNQYATDAYRAFFDSPEPLWYQSVPAPDGRHLTPHDPGLPLLLAPAYALGGPFLAKRLLAILAAAMVAMVFVIALRLTGRAGPALLAAGALAVTAPVFVYATQVYPEMPAALVIAGLIWLVLADGMRPFPRAVLLAAGLIALPWLGVKYALVGAVVAGFALFRFNRRASILLLALLVIGGMHYVWFHLSRYGGITPYTVNVIEAANDTAAVAGLDVRIWSRLYRLLGLFVDREFGLLRWAPVLLLALPGSLIAIRRWGWRGWFLAAVVAAQLMVAVFLSLTMRGWWFPGRMLVAVLPVMGIWIGTTLDSIRDVRFWAFAGVLAALSGWITLALWQEVSARWMTLAVDPFALDLTVFRGIAGAFPLYTAYGLDTWMLSGLWLLVLVVFSAAVAWIQSRQGAGRVRAWESVVPHAGREECHV